MNRDEAKAALDHLCHDWRVKTRRLRTAPEDLSFTDFRTWLEEEGYGHYLDFESTAGPLYDAELWFDEAFGQTWRR